MYSAFELKYRKVVTEAVVQGLLMDLCHEKKPNSCQYPLKNYLGENPLNAINSKIIEITAIDTPAIAS